MIQYLTREEVDEKKWNALISSSPGALPYAFIFYLDIAADRKWDALVLDDYNAAMPLPRRRKAGISYIYTPYFIQQLGIFSKEDLTEHVIAEFIESIPAKFRFGELNMNIGNDFLNKNFKTKLRVTHHLNLDQPYNLCSARYNENTKRNLKKAQNAELQIDDQISGSELIHLFQSEKSKEVSELKKADYTRLNNLIQYLIRNRKGEIYGVKNVKGKYCAGGFYVVDSRMIINLFPISNEEGRKNSAMFLLIDYIIRKYADSRRILDFEGSEIPGIARFYKGFGGEEKYFPQLKINRLPKAIQWIKK